MLRAIIPTTLKIGADGGEMISAGQFISGEFGGELVQPHDAALETNCYVGFFSLDDQVRSNFFKEVSGHSRANNPHPDVSDTFVPADHRVEWPMGYASSERFLEGSADLFVTERDFYSETMPECVPSLGANNGDAAISVEHPGSIFRRHGGNLLERDGMVAKSGETENRQPRAKQVERPGVCNEHVPPAKAKMCSGLRGNTERMAETSIPDMAGYYPTPKPSSSNKTGIGNALRVGCI